MSDFAGKELYNLNNDGSVRAEVIVGGRVVPLEYYAKLLGVGIDDAIVWKKHDLMRLLLDAEFLTDDYRKCDNQGELLEDENFEPLPGKEDNSGWGSRLRVKNDGSSVLTEDEFLQLSDIEQQDYRALSYIVVKPARLLFPKVEVLVTEEATSILAGMLAKTVKCGDIELIRRCYRECKIDENFAMKYGYALDAACDELDDDAATGDILRSHIDEFRKAIFSRMPDSSDQGEFIPHKNENLKPIAWGEIHFVNVDDGEVKPESKKSEEAAKAEETEETGKGETEKAAEDCGDCKNCNCKNE